MKKLSHALLVSLLIYFMLIQGSKSRILAQTGGSQYIAVPDYVAGQVRIISTDDSQEQLGFSTPGCNPNSTAFNEDMLYVICNKDFGNADKILVYNFQNLANLKPQGSRIQPIKTIVSPEFNGLIAAAFDLQNALWVSSYYNHQILRLSSDSLDFDNPQIDKKLIHSPDRPVGLAFDGQDGSMWVVGQYQGGLVIKIPRSELDSPGDNVNGISVVDAQPVDCFSNDAPGCKHIPGLFDNPEGIAILNNEIWVSNNGGDHPAASLVRLRPNQSQSARFGGGVGKPFSCPGGLSTDGLRLWVNDQSFGQTNTTCGQDDRRSAVDGVLAYNPSALNDPNNIGSPSKFFRGVTSRPGFGGITVFSSSIRF